MRELAITQTVLPLLAMIWLVSGRAPSRAELVLRLAGAWLLLIGISAAGVWLALPQFTTVLLNVLLALASFIAIRRLRSDEIAAKSRPVTLWTGRLAALAIVLLGLWLCVPALAGRRPPPHAVELVFPLRNGRYLVANGGAAERINGHFITLQPRYARWRGESYGVDLIKVDEYGFRTRDRRLLALPADPAAYLSFGERVFSPCAGVVDEAAADRPDMSVPVRDRAHLEGNFVRLRCGAVVVLLAHFERGTVRVRRGERVTIGQPLGAIGNSGNSDEPHLHIHVQTPGTVEAPLAGEPLFATFDRQFPVRNMVIRVGTDQR